ncbi:MAG: hypothetical protein EZS28_019259 [Streblomastix strix]|uniref:Uncharacterized protein n=1 Tax=Streblomastix strix TaxID=222440 RepID=A0A5J4VRL1_9EUKA|nr:MAG: hypothetical protein EZS28_019259 [Streblomastix strix]
MENTNQQPGDPPAMNQPVPPNHDANQAPIHAGTGLLQILGAPNGLQSMSNALPHRPEEELIQKQLKAVTKGFELYYDQKAEDLDPTDERASQEEISEIEERIKTCIELELNKKGAKAKVGDKDPASDAETARLAVQGQRAIVAAASSLGLEDQEVAMRWLLTCHHIFRIIGGQSQQCRELTLAPDKFKSIMGKKGDSLQVFGQKSIKKVKEAAKSVSLLQTSFTPEVQPAQPIQIQSQQLPSIQAQILQAQKQSFIPFNMFNRSSFFKSRNQFRQQRFTSPLLSTPNQFNCPFKIGRQGQLFPQRHMQNQQQPFNQQQYQHQYYQQPFIPNQVPQFQNAIQQSQQQIGQQQPIVQPLISQQQPPQ